MRLQGTEQISGCNKSPLTPVAYQANCLCNQRPTTQEMSHNEATQNGLDFRYTALFGVGRKLANQDAGACGK